MSSYISFFVRVNDTFAPIGSWSRNSEMYQAMQDWCPYEKIRAFSFNDLMNVVKELEDKAREADEKRCQMIMQANNSVEEKMEAVNEIESNYEEMDSFIEEVQFAADTLRVFCNMIDDFKFAEIKFTNDYNHYIYAGIEVCGTLEEVVE